MMHTRTQNIGASCASVSTKKFEKLRAPSIFQILLTYLRYPSQLGCV